MKTLGAYIRKARTRSGLTLRQLESATEGSVSNAYISQIENGRVKQPSPVILNALAKALNVQPSNMMVLAGYGPIDLDGKLLAGPCETCRYCAASLLPSAKTCNLFEGPCYGRPIPRDFEFGCTLHEEKGGCDDE